MGTGTMLDLRRTDLRSHVLENPYWITSSIIAPAADDQDAVLFSFPIAPGVGVSPGYGNSVILIHQIILEVVTAFAGGTVDMLVGVGSIATDAAVTGDTVTDVDVDEYFATTDHTLGTAACYFPTGGDWLTIAAANTFAAYGKIVPADATVLCIEAQLTSTATITAGRGVIHVLISEVPALR